MGGAVEPCQKVIRGRILPGPPPTGFHLVGRHACHGSGLRRMCGQHARRRTQFRSQRELEDSAMQADGAGAGLASGSAAGRTLGWHTVQEPDRTGGLGTQPDGARAGA